MGGALLVGVEARLVGDGEPFLDQDEGDVALGGDQGRQGAAVAVGPAGSLDGDRALEELAQASRGEQPFSEFGVTAGLGDFWGVRFDEADAFPGQLDGVAVDDADQVAVDRLGVRWEGGQGEQACED
jgi:hypothetical protein